MDSDAAASQGTRQKTSKSLRSGKKVAPKLDAVPEKKKRSWESWSFEDKNIFFDGLKQFGRDFGAIKRFMASKMRKDSQIKNKEQVRHLYYRTWSTVSKMIDQKMFPDGITEKGAQEWYAMMAYGEIRRRMKSEPNKKVLEAKFEELLKTQQTLIKHKGKSIKVKVSLPDSAKSPDSLVSHLDTKISVLLSPSDCYSLRCVQSVGACPHLNVKIPVQTSFLELKEMLAEKWNSSVSRIDLRMQLKSDSGGPHGASSRADDASDSPDKIRIDDLQKFKNGRLTVHYSRMTLEHLPPASNIDNTSILSIFLLTDQPENVRLCYRFIRDRPVCEPVSLLAKCASIFTEVIYDVDKSKMESDTTSDVDEMLRNSILASQSLERDRRPKSSRPKGPAKRATPVPQTVTPKQAKETISVSAEAVEMHLQQLNGLNRPNRGNRNADGRSPAYTAEHLTPDHSARQLKSYSPNQAHQAELELIEPHNDSNGSISHILRSVLNSDHLFPSTMETEMENQLAHLLNENSIDYERMTNFSDLLNETDDDL